MGMCNLKLQAVSGHRCSLELTSAPAHAAAAAAAAASSPPPLHAAGEEEIAACLPAPSACGVGVASVGLGAVSMVRLVAVRCKREDVRARL